VAVIGATTWGTTLAALLARNGHVVRLLCRSSDEAREAATPGVRSSANVAETLASADLVLMAVPSQTVRANAMRIARALPSGTPFLHATKGLEHGTAKRVSQMLLEELAQITPGDICVVSGPNLAGEIQRGLPAATVIAGTNAENVEKAQRLFHSAAFRVYTSHDVVGVELAGALKNVVAIAAGIADGLELGDNAKAGIITRGMAEMTRLGVAAGADAATFAGLAGMGDVMATCYSPLSRNRRCGESLGRGMSVAEAAAGAGGVVEGIEATAAACVLAERHGVEMPIAAGLRSVLFESASPLQAIARLLERQPGREGE
jgi:glycerol-3-phosphate dehydrogenase (NAD(P)+)